jgi:hypothetical protein
MSEYLHDQEKFAMKTGTQRWPYPRATARLLCTCRYPWMVSFSELPLSLACSPPPSANHPPRPSTHRCRPARPPTPSPSALVGAGTLWVLSCPQIAASLSPIRRTVGADSSCPKSPPTQRMTMHPMSLPVTTTHPPNEQRCPDAHSPLDIPVFHETLVLETPSLSHLSLLTPPS